MIDLSQRRFSHAASNPPLRLEQEDDMHIVSFWSTDRGAYMWAFESFDKGDAERYRDDLEETLRGRESSGDAVREVVQ